MEISTVFRFFYLVLSEIYNYQIFVRCLRLHREKIILRRVSYQLDDICTAERSYCGKFSEMLLHTFVYLLKTCTILEKNAVFMELAAKIGWKYRCVGIMICRSKCVFFHHVRRPFLARFHFWSSYACIIARYSSPLRSRPPSALAGGTMDQPLRFESVRFKRLELTRVNSIRPE